MQCKHKELNEKYIQLSSQSSQTTSLSVEEKQNYMSQVGEYSTQINNLKQQNTILSSQIKILYENISVLENEKLSKLMNVTIEEIENPTETINQLRELLTLANNEKNSLTSELAVVKQTSEQIKQKYEHVYFIIINIIYIVKF